jgi:hypothetical protein
MRRMRLRGYPARLLVSSVMAIFFRLSRRWLHPTDDNRLNFAATTFKGPGEVWTSMLRKMVYVMVLLWYGAPLVYAEEPRAMFERSTPMAAGSPALPVMQEIEDELKAAVDSATDRISKR